MQTAFVFVPVPVLVTAAEFEEAASNYSHAAAAQLAAAAPDDALKASARNEVTEEPRAVQDEDSSDGEDMQICKSVSLKSDISNVSEISTAASIFSNFSSVSSGSNRIADFQPYGTTPSYSSYRYTVPSCTASSERRLSTEYPPDMVVRNTFLDFASDSINASARTRARSEEPLRKSSSLAVPECEETGISNLGVGCPGQALKLPVAAPLMTSVARQTPAEDGRRKPLESPQVALTARRFPTLGSALHAAGTCQPCAFFWKDATCVKGIQCQFCHLCGPLEKKRRQKEKKAAMKAKAAKQAQVRRV